MREASARGREGFVLAYVGRSSAQIERDFGDRLARLLREGFDVRVYAADDGGFGGLARRGVDARPIPVGVRRNVAGLLGAFFMIQADFLERPPVLVHAFDDALAWVGALAAKRSGVPAVFVTREEHDWVEPVEGVARSTTEEVLGAVEAMLGSPLRRGYEEVHRRLVGWVDRYLVTNEHDFDLLQRRDLVPAKKLEIVLGGHGVDLSEFPVGEDGFPSVEEAREALELPSRWRRVVGYVGSLGRESEARALLEAMEACAERYPAAGWLVALEGEVGGTRREALAAWEARGQAVVMEMPAERGPVYRAMDLLFEPSGRAGAARVMMEAAATRVASLACDSPTARAIIADQQTGELMSAGSMPRLHGAIEQSKRWSDYGVRARARASQRFSRHHVEDQIMRLYDTTLEVNLAQTPLTSDF